MGQDLYHTQVSKQIAPSDRCVCWGLVWSAVLPCAHGCGDCSNHTGLGSFAMAMATEAHSDHSAGRSSQSQYTQHGVTAILFSSALSLQMLQQATTATDSADSTELASMAAEGFDFDDALRAFEAPLGNGKRGSNSNTVQALARHGVGVLAPSPPYACRRKSQRHQRG